MWSFAIFKFSDTFVKSMNRKDVSFKSQYMLGNLASIDKGFTYNITHDSNNKATNIVWISSYMRDHFDRFGNYLSIDGGDLIVIFVIAVYLRYYVLSVLNSLFSILFRTADRSFVNYFSI